MDFKRILKDVRAEACSDLRGCHFIPDCGHWNTQEKPEETTKALIHFLESTQSLPGGSLTKCNACARSQQALKRALRSQCGAIPCAGASESPSEVGRQVRSQAND